MSIKEKGVSQFVGIPFVNGGRSLEGADCWGTAMLVFGHFGTKLPDYRISCFETKQINGQIDLERKDWVRLEEPEVPCLIVMRINPHMPEFCNHLGVYIGGGWFIHTLLKTMSKRERLDHPFFKNTIEGFYRYAGG